ncbi:SRPBCC domain-containing protein, partial [Thalassospira profundimaris]
FTDETGIANPSLPRSHVTMTFTDQGEHTLTETVVAYNSAKDLQTVIDMGMEAGLASTLERLDELLLKLTA